MIGRYAQVDEGGVVVNVVLWDGETPFDSGLLLVEISDDVSHGWKWAGGTWVSPPSPEPEPPVVDPLSEARESAVAKLQALGLLSDEEVAALLGT